MNAVHTSRKSSRLRSTRKHLEKLYINILNCCGFAFSEVVKIISKLYMQVAVIGSAKSNI